jgi:oligopeptide transport system substrate-binding protein
MARSFTPQSERNDMVTNVIMLVGCLALMIACVVFVAIRPRACTAAAGCCGSCAPDSPQNLSLQGVGATDVRTLDPPNATDPLSLQIVENVYPGLVALDPNLQPIPWAAQALPTVSSDGLTWTFTLRPGLKWSDGTPITAQTFAYSIDRALNPCNAFNAAYYLYPIKDAVAFNADEVCDQQTHTIKGPIQTLIGDSIHAPNAQTLVITLARPETAFLAAIAYPAAAAVPQQLIEQYGAKYTEHLADGSGFGGDLFRVTKWVHAGELDGNHVSHLVLQRNDNFWGDKPRLREVDYTFFKDASTAYNAYLAGHTDVGFAPAAQLTQAKTHQGFHQIPIQQIDYYSMNWTKAPFNDLRMRKAFALALDKQAIVNNVLHDTVLSTNHIVPNGTPGFNPGLLGPDGTQSLTGDPQLANHLAAAYAADTGCGAATDFSRCPKVTLTVYSSDSQAVAEAARQMWLKAMPRYPISIQMAGGGLLQSLSAKQQFQLQAQTWVGDYPDPQDWLSTNLTCDSPYNVGNACDRQVDQLMKQAGVIPDQAARLEEYQQAEQALVTEVAWLPLDQATTWWEVKPYLKNYTVSPNGLIPKQAWQTMFLTAH